MGGINPNKGVRPTTGNITALTQEVCLGVFDGAAQFYNGQAFIEKIVLDETAKRKAKEANVKKAAAAIEKSGESFSKVLEIVKKNNGMIRENGTWHQPYFESIYPRLMTLSKMSKSLAKAITSKSFLKSFQAGDTQKSLWSNGANAKIRVDSLAFLDALNELMSIHSEFVKITNKPKSKFLA